MGTPNAISYLKNGDTVLYIGIGIFKWYFFLTAVLFFLTANSMIFAMNDGKLVASRLMHKHTRSTMSVEQSRGRKYLEEKLMGGVAQEVSSTISDVYFVDWLAEAMGGFAVPPMLKEYRVSKKYLMFGLTFLKDTERMVASEITMELISQNPNEFTYSLIRLL